MSARATRAVEQRRNDIRLVQIAWLGSRGLLAAVCIVAMLVRDVTFERAVTRWDVSHFTKIATEGYADHLEVAFFPGLPALLAAGDRVGMPMHITGIVLALIGSALAAWALFRIGGPLAASLWLIAPTAIFTVVPYTESLFCAAAFWAWERARAGRWATAAMLAGIACTFRVSGLFLIGALGLLALTTGRDHISKKLARCLWMIIPTAVLAAYVIFLYRLTGSWTAWFDAQAQGWSRGFTLPWDSLQHTLDAAKPEAWPGRPEVPLVFGAEVVSMAFGVLTTVICLGRRQWGEAGWVGVQVFAFATSWWFVSVNRAVLLWFPLFVIAGGLAAWTPKGDGRASDIGHIAWQIVVGALVLLDLAAMVAWAWIYFTGGWAS